MKVLIINGSPRINGNSSRLVKELSDTFLKEGVETDIYQIGNKAIRGCMVCGYCYEHGECVFKDDINDLSKRFKDADGLIYHLSCLLWLCERFYYFFIRPTFLFISF